VNIDIEEIAQVLQNLFAGIREELDMRDNVREEAIRITREIIRESGWAITSLLANDMEKCKKHIQRAKDLSKQLVGKLENYPDILYSGLVYNALSEFVEAYTLYNILTKSTLPDFKKEFRVHHVPILQGLGDVIGELRRYILELIRSGDYERAFAILKIMEALYMQLRGLDYPEALMPSVRHKTDVARRLIDDTKALLIDIHNREKLRQSIEHLKKLESSKEAVNQMNQ